MNTFSFFLSRRLFICPSILNDTFAGQSNLGYRFLLFMTLNISWQSLLVCKISFQKSAYSLMGTPLQVTNCFSLTAFKILSLWLTFSILIVMCLFASALFGTLHAPWTYTSIFFSKLGKFSFIYFFQIDFQFLTLSPLLLASL